jgi:hypothetical protein
MEDKLQFYKEIFKDIATYQKKEEINFILEELEQLSDELSENIIKEIEKFSKTFPLPLYYFSLIRIIKLAMDLKNKLFINYNYYFNLYNNLRKKINKIEEENRLLNEVGEILYRMDEIDGNLKRIIPNLIEVIRKQINQNQEEESVFLKKITSESYSEIYPAYEDLVKVILNLLDELKLEKGLYKLSRLLIEEANIQMQ